MTDLLSLPEEAFLGDGVCSAEGCNKIGRRIIFVASDGPVCYRFCSVHHHEVLLALKEAGIEVLNYNPAGEN